jgi:signal transduction histidine kinase
LNLPQVLADGAALTRDSNLLTNAMKYGGQSRWIGLSAQTKDAPHETEVRITIEDKGHGISPSDLPHISSRFVAGARPSPRKFTEAVWLEFIKRIVEAHNGRISVESAHGHGSSFTLHLPATMIVRNVDDNNGSIGNNGSTGNEYEKANSAC